MGRRRAEETEPRLLTSKAGRHKKRPALLFVVARSQARKTRVIDPATYPRIRFPDNSLPGQLQIAQEAV